MTTSVERTVAAAKTAVDRTTTFYARHGKRLFDLAIAVPGTLAVSPVIGGIALVVRATSGAPVFFRQERVGRDGQIFRIYKFRTMVVGAVNQGAGIYLEENDSRITWAGCWLRSTSLDELPQLFNVLRGEMSLVGPRPNLPEIVARYGHLYDRILTVKPGVTCLVGIRGRNRLRRSQMLAYDEEYVATMGLLQDMRILLKTIPAVLFQHGSTNDVSEEFLEDVEPVTQAAVAADAAEVAGATEVGQSQAAGPAPAGVASTMTGTSATGGSRPAKPR